MMQGISKDREELDQMSQQFSELGLDDDELLKELDNLSVSDQHSTIDSNAEKQNIDQKRLDTRIAEWEKKLLD